MPVGLGDPVLDAVAGRGQLVPQRQGHALDREHRVVAAVQHKKLRSRRARSRRRRAEPRGHRDGRLEDVL
eukprot:3187231-Prymnesium_polylepis.1